MNFARRAELGVAGIALLLGCSALGCQGEPEVIDVYYPTAGAPGDAAGAYSAAGSGTGAMAGMGGGGGNSALQNCALPWWYDSWETLTENDCTIEIADKGLQALIESFLTMYAAQLAGNGESRGFDFCDRDMQRVWFVPDPMDPSKLKLCMTRCEFLKEELKAAKQRNEGCLAAAAGG